MEAVLDPVPPAVVTEIVPVDAPDGMEADNCVAERTVHPLVTVLDPTFTEVAPARFVPVIVMSSPVRALRGETFEICGAAEVALTAKLPELSTLAPQLNTVILPLVAPAGTDVTMVVGLRTWHTGATVALIRQVAGAKKFDPLRVTEVPTPPDAGVSALTDGAGSNLAATWRA